MKILTVIGARPQFVKAAVVSRAIAEHNSNNIGFKIREVLVHTGQHYDKNMSDIFFDEMHIPKPDYHLNINGLSHGAMTGQMLEKIENVILDESPDYVLVYGDTNSTLAGALAAVKLHIPVAHVEAGLRSFNRRMPEEINRVMTDHISTKLFCPTDQAIENLRFEGIVDEGMNKVINTGDVMFDAALFYKKNMRKPPVELADNFILSTLHRAENTDDLGRFQSIFEGFSEISEEKQIVMPLHPRTKAVIKNQNLNTFSENLLMIDPVSYYEMIYLLDHCGLVMTDSGGLQKEAYFFKKPCLTLRDETEWVELVDNGFNYVTGADTKKIISAYNNMKDKSILSGSLYGEGNAGQEIVNNLIL